jgi:hypothetical protein
VTRVPLAPVFFFVGCPAVPFSLGAFGWAARFVGTLLFASLPSTFKIGAPCETATSSSQLLVTVCGIPNSAELGVRIRNSAESSVLDEILWNPDAARAESADRGRISLWEQAWTRNSAVCTVYENGSPAGEEPPNAKFFVLHAR